MSAQLPSDIPPERAPPGSPVLPARGTAWHVTAPARSGPGPAAGSPKRLRATRWLGLGLPRARLTIAVELVQTLGLAAVSGAALFVLLGGGGLLLRAHAVPGAVGWGGGFMGAGLGMIALWGLWRTVAAVQVLQRAAPGLQVDPAEATVRRAVRDTQRLPYYLAGGFLGAGVGGGGLAAVRLDGLRSEDRVVAALLWGFCCGIAALGVVLRLRSFIAPVAQALQARAPDSVRPLLSVRSKLLCGFGWLLLCVTVLSLLKQLLLAPGESHSEGQVAVLGLRGLLFLLPVQVAAAGGVVALAVVGLAWPVRDLLRRASAVVGESRGALQRPIVLGVSATAEVVELQRLFDQLRRLLLSRLRSSTEQNLQLEAEVARRTGELSRRNAELCDALFRLQSAREELLRAEKLAKVGRIAAGITGEIDAPVARMTSHCGQLTAAVQELIANLTAASPLVTTPQNALLLDRALLSLTALTDGATRVRDLVRAMRVYIRPGATSATSWDVAEVVDDVRQLFDEP